ncbi:MAG: DNA replication/repair protein RecF [Oscillospiraceae bacterium]|jgi:DNA replication and repair protein RecF|nr:DNA replication/repair protein RecF [Oscillospiraceae bacterium]
MYVKQLELKNFRNYQGAFLSPHPRLTVLTGQNAQGKTNVLEALHLCCLGRSHRTAHDRELIRWGTERAAVRLQVARTDGTHDIAVTLTQDGRRKQVKVGGTQIGRIGELMGHFHGILFSPEDLAIIKQGPAERRKLVDMELSQLYPAYFYTLQRYMRALNQRNSLLREMQRGHGGSAATLQAWDEQLVQAGAHIVGQRRAYLALLAQAAAASYAGISGGTEALGLRYQTQIDSDGDKAQLAAQFLHRLRETRADDIRRGSTSVGPHRDEMRLTLNGREARVYGSQGQQRTVMLSLRLAELEVVRMERGETPVLLLDDVMSELDPFRRRQLLERIADAQTLITCTDESDLAGASIGAVYRVREGTLTPA